MFFFTLCCHVVVAKAQLWYVCSLCSEGTVDSSADSLELESVLWLKQGPHKIIKTSETLELHPPIESTPFTPKTKRINILKMYDL